MTRLGYALMTLLMAELFGSLFAAVAWFDPQPRLLWNASASAPIGLYRLHPGAHMNVGNMVAILPPRGLARLMAQRNYLPIGVPLLKHVGALPGQRVCRRGVIVTVDGRHVAKALVHDRHGRALSVWQGCSTVRTGTLFLLNPALDSFDSRYFGAVPMSGLKGRAVPVLTRDAPDQPLRWRGLGGLNLPASQYGGHAWHT
jgi:conjugative transfer signal peptidase TraF